MSEEQKGRIFNPDQRINVGKEEPLDRTMHFVEHGCDHGGGIIVQALRASQAEVSRLTAELEAAREAMKRAAVERLDDTFLDEKGTTWRRPTAYAYYAACKALAEKEAELAKIELVRDNAIGKYHAEVKRGRIACEDFVRIETARLANVNAGLRETIKKYSDERDSVREILLKEMDGVKDRELNLHQQVAKLANLRYYAEKSRDEARQVAEGLRAGISDLAEIVDDIPFNVPERERLKNRLDSLSALPQPDRREEPLKTAVRAWMRYYEYTPKANGITEAEQQDRMRAAYMQMVRLTQDDRACSASAEKKEDHGR